LRKPYWQYLYVFVLLPCLIYTVFHTAHAIRLDYTPVPIWDAWRCVQYVDQLLRFDLRHFWVQHNEHRIVFPEMVYALDYICFRGVQLLPIACNIACQLVQLALLWWLLGQMKDMALAFRLALGAGCCLFMTSAMQVQGILGPFELQWYLSQMAAALSFLFLTRSAQTGRWASLAMSIAAAVIANYSTSNGMLLWPVLVTMAVLQQLPKARIACLASAGILSIAAYFVDYTFMGQGRTAVLLGHPFYAVWFMGVFLGTPVSYLSSGLGGLAGLSGLLLVAIAVAVAIRQRRSREPAFAVTAGVSLYIAGSALLIAYGRMNPADPAAGAALAPRYISVPLTYSANLTVVVGWLIMRLPRARRPALELAAAVLTLASIVLATAVLVLVSIVAVVRPQKSYEAAFAARQALAHESGIALVSGIEDADLIRVIFPRPEFVLETMPAIRRKRLSIFAAGRQDWIGQPVSRLFALGSPSLCAGAVETWSAVTGGYRAAGWASELGVDIPPKDIVLADSAGAIIGFGETRPGGYPHRSGDSARRPPSDRDWVGFMRTQGPPGTIQAYAIVHGGDIACAIGSPQQVPAVMPVGPS
jgi:hypothetical protein